MRLAAIDVGSNSIHMVIADVSRDGRIQVVDRVKEMVRLGRHTFVTGALPDAAMELAVQSLATYGRLARARHVKKVRAVATSAVREASNRAAFIKRLRRETGIDVEVIPGAEEARLILRAVRHALGLEQGSHLVVDIGGGSLELALVRDGRARWIESLPLGVARLTERFLTKDPPTARQVRQLEKHLEKTLGPWMAQARRAGVVRGVATSGTLHTIVAMARAGAGDELPRLHGATASRSEVRALRRRLLAVASAERATLPGMDAKRADLMPAAAVLVDFIVAQSGIEDLQACSWALREGVLLQLADAKTGHVVRTTAARRRSVQALARQFAGTNAHGRHVARLATRLFDQLAPMLGLPPSARELLEYAALLHDIGRSVDHERHHRHSAYLIRNGELLHFDPLEIETIAQVARGHRKQIPRREDADLARLPPGGRRLVRALTTLLRVADALDRTHFGVIRALSVRRRDRRYLLCLDPGGGNAELELWAAQRRIDQLAKLLDRPVELVEQRRREPPRRAAVGG